MTLDVVFSPQGLSPADVAGRTVFVIDALRATTTICAALHHGARAVVPAPSSEDAVRVAQSVGARDAVLAGERQCIRIPGFALGNSPLEMTAEAVGGKLVVQTTTNGTRALLATQGAHAVYAAAAVNLTLAGTRARQALEEEGDLVVICAGREGAFGLDDAYVAGRLAIAALGGHRLRRGLNDAALAALDLVRRYGDTFLRPFSYSAAGRHLAKLGMADDVRDAARLDANPVLPLFRDRRLTVAPAAVPA
jgi:2-phosphosulfolactate phosphatase